MVRLFDMLLGGVTTDLLSMELRPTLIDTIVDYEARATQLEGRKVTNAELVDKAVKLSSSLQAFQALTNRS